MLRFKAASLFICLILILLLTSCPDPINEVHISQLKDTVGPVITVLEPKSYTTYTSRAPIVVRGTVKDSSTGAQSPGLVTSLVYAVSGGVPPVEKEVEPDAQGNFLFDVATVVTEPGTGQEIAAEDSITIRLTATDWNNNKTELSLFLIGKDFSVEVFSRNKGAELRWREPPYTAGYTLHYSVNSNDPPQATGTHLDIVPQYDGADPANASYTLEIPELSNGCSLSLLLQARAEEGYADSWSTLVTTIPLSPLTLLPQVIEGYKQLKLAWPAIEATTKFDVYKSTGGRNGTYTQLLNAFEGTSYIDTDVHENTLYFYKVCPDGYDSTLSSMAAGSGKASFELPLIYDGQDNHPRIKRIEKYNTGEMEQSDWFWVTYNDVVVRGNSAYVLDSETGVIEYNISSPASPVWMRTWPIFDAHSLAIDDAFPNHLFVLSDSRLYFLNTADTAVINSAEDVPYLLFLFESLQDLAIHNATVYLATASGGLQIVDISDINAPETLSPSTAVAGALTSLAVDKTTNTLFVCYADVFCGIYALDIGSSFAHAPELKQTFAGLSFSPYNITVRGTRMYLSDYGEFKIFDISTPHAIVPFAYQANTDYERDLPQFYECFKELLFPNAFALYGLNRPFFIDGTNGYLLSGSSLNQTYCLYLVGLDDPLHPVITGSIRLRDDAPQSVYVSDGYAYVACDSSFYVVDISQPDLLPAGRTAGLQDYQDLALYDNYACLVSANNGLAIVDTNVPASPQVLRQSFREPAGANYRSLAVHGDYAVITDSQNGKLYTIDIANPAEPRFIKAYTVPGAGEVVLKGDYAFVASGTSSPGALHIIDISGTDPDRPPALHLVRMESTSSKGGLQLTGNQLYIGSVADGLVRLDLSLPHPDSIYIDSVLSESSKARNCENLAVSGNSIYLSSTEENSSTLYLYTYHPAHSLASFAQPIVPDNSYVIQDLSYYNALLFTAHGQGGLKLYSTAAPAYLGIVDTCRSTDCEPVAVTVRAGHVYLVDLEHGLTVLSF